jgi:hypothetical protein
MPPFDFSNFRLQVRQSLFNLRCFCAPVRTSLRHKVISSVECCVNHCWWFYTSNENQSLLLIREQFRIHPICSYVIQLRLYCIHVGCFYFYKWWALLSLAILRRSSSSFSSCYIGDVKSQKIISSDKGIRTSARSISSIYLDSCSLYFL